MIPVLVVESNSSVRASIATLIEGIPGLPIRVQEAANGNEALQILKKMPLPELMITNHMDFVKSARRLAPNLKVVVVSYHANELESEVYAYLPKPFDAKALISLMKGISSN